jgi:Protein of unknown function (DUF3631)
VPRKDWTKAYRDALKRIRDLDAHRNPKANPNAKERRIAEKKLLDALRKLKKTINDLSALLAEWKVIEDYERDEKDAAAARTMLRLEPAPDCSCLDLTDYLARQYVGLQEHEYTVYSLWTLLTYVFREFMQTPRLTFVSPTARCGKSRAMHVLQRLAWRAEKHDSITTAVLYRTINEGARTMLLDEMDNADLANNRELRRILNAGHEKGGTFSRVFDRRVEKFNVFAPVALAAIATSKPLPSPIITRSIMIRTQLSTPKRLYDTRDPRDRELDIAHAQNLLWARSNPQLNFDPEIPAELRDPRQRDNWRPLISIADAFGPEWGKRARDAALAFKGTYRSEDYRILVLEDIYDIFNARSVNPDPIWGGDRILRDELVEALLKLETADWKEYEGRKLTRGRLKDLLVPFGIEAKPIWPPQRTASSKSGRGYMRSQFEDHWSRYDIGTAASDAAPAQKRSNLKLLSSK